MISGLSFCVPFPSNPSTSVMSLTSASAVSLFIALPTRIQYVNVAALQGRLSLPPFRLIMNADNSHVKNSDSGDANSPHAQPVRVTVLASKGQVMPRKLNGVINRHSVKPEH